MNKLFIVELMGEDAMMRAGIQPVRASRFEEQVDYVSFFDGDGKLHCFFPPFCGSDVARVICGRTQGFAS